MKFLFLGCLSLGAIAVFQPLLNRAVAENKGLALAVWINSLVLFFGASMLLMSVTLFTNLYPDIFALRSQGPWKFWYIFPGFMGLALVIGLPLMIKNIGAFATFMTFLSGQLLVSFTWDWFNQNQNPGLARFLGLILALVGTYLSIRPSI
jgi:uncharacterized membrane protein YdcZ (DUF606 family)